MAALEFNKQLEQHLPKKAGKGAHFDCRVWNVPTAWEAVNALIWRELDATKNSISMAAHCHFSHKELLGKSTKERQEMLFQKGVNWNDYPDFFKRGTYVQSYHQESKFTAAEIEKLPEKHEARTNPDLMVVRRYVEPIHLPPLARVGNPIDVVFNGQTPKAKKDENR